MAGQYVRNHWYAAALTGEIAGGRLLARTVLAESILLFRTGDGRLVAVEDRCPHRNVALSLGRVVGERLQCGYHGLQFDVGGRCVHMPGTDAKPPAQLRLRTYCVAERYGYVWIWMGVEEEADIALVPDYSWQSDPAWTGALHVQATNCNYRLALENVLDLSHVTFVHNKTVGTPEVAETPAQVVTGDGLVRISRHFEDAVLPPVYQQATGWTRARRTQEISYFAVNCILLEVVIEPVGGVDPEARKILRFAGPYTPERHGSHLHFSSAYRNFDLADGALTERLIETIRAAYAEDVPFLESQQQLLDRGVAQANRLYAVDKGPVLAMRMLDDRLHQEALPGAGAGDVALSKTTGVS